MQVIEREEANLRKMRDCKNIVQLLKSYRERVALNELRIDLLFEFCPIDLQKIIWNKKIIFRLAEVKTFLHEILCGIRAMHEQKVERTTYLGFSVCNKIKICFFFI